MMSIFNHIKPTRIVFFSLSVALSLTACSTYAPDHFSENKVRVQEEKIAHSMASDEVSEAALAGLAEHYRRHGEGPLSLTYTYDPKSKSNSAMKAGERAANAADILRKQGVDSVETNILPVADSGNYSKVIVSYLGYNALAPQDCEVMPGVYDRRVDVNSEYKMGCSLDTLFARQIARPKDLLGQANDVTSDGRRAANMVEVHRAGLGNESLGGESASE